MIYGLRIENGSCVKQRLHIVAVEMNVEMCRKRFGSNSSRDNVTGGRPLRRNAHNFQDAQLSSPFVLTLVHATRTPVVGCWLISIKSCPRRESVLRTKMFNFSHPNDVLMFLFTLNIQFFFFAPRALNILGNLIFIFRFTNATVRYNNKKTKKDAYCSRQISRNLTQIVVE